MVCGIHEVGASRMRGARPSFTEFHKWMALELIAEKKRISRKELSRWLSLGEGSVRTLLEELKREGMVASCRSGHSLTVKGWKYLGEPLRYVQVDVKGITVGRVNVATLVRGAAEKVNPIRQRDEAIKVGASGATVLVFKKGKLRFPEDFMEVPSEVQEKLVQLFQPREGDVIVIGTGDSIVTAIAFGSGGMGFTGGCEYVNTCFPWEYIGALANNKLPVAGARRVSKEERAVRYVLERLGV